MDVGTLLMDRDLEGTYRPPKFIYFKTSHIYTNTMKNQYIHVKVNNIQNIVHIAFDKTTYNVWK